MSLSNSITTMLIDPRSHNNTRTEFRLDDNYYASSLKLIDVGVFSSNVAGPSGSTAIVTYPQINGVYQCIRNIYLYSGSTLLDSVQNCAQFSAIQALKATNQGSTDLNRDLILNGMGFAQARASVNNSANYADRRPGSLATTLDQKYKQCATHGGANIVNNQSLIASEQDEQSGAVSLGVFLQFLKSISVLPRIPDLRILIEWDTNADSYFTQAGATGALQVIRPTLVCEVIEGMPMEPPDLSVPYMSTIVERFNVPRTFTTANTTLGANPFAFTQASKVVTVTNTANLGLVVGEPIVFQGVVSIDRASMALGTDKITTSAGAIGSAITIELTAHGLETGDKFTLAGATQVDNETAAMLNSEHTATKVNANSFTFPSQAANAAATAGGGANCVITGKLIDQVAFNGNLGFTVASVTPATSFTFELAAASPDSPASIVAAGGGAACVLTHRSGRTNPTQTSFRSQAFTEKFVRELVFFNNTTDQLAANQRFLTAATRSPAQLNERLQLIVNNVNHLPDQGISNEAMRIMYLNSAQSSMNIPYICMLEGTGDQRNALTATVPAGTIANAQAREFIYPHGALKNNFSITAAKVGARVDSLRIEHQRTYGTQNGSRDAYTLLCFGTVARNLMMKNGQIRVSY